MRVCSSAWHQPVLGQPEGVRRGGSSPPDARTAWRGSQEGPSPPAAPEVILPHFTLLLQSLCTQIFGFASGYFIRLNDGRHNRRSCYKQFSGLVI